MGYAAASALAIGAMFAYIAGSPFVFIELNGVRPDRYGLLFGANAVGLILASQFNRWLLRYYTSGRILRVALAIMAGSALLLAAATATGFGGFQTMLLLLFFCISSNGLVQPNALALAMAPHGRQAGSASALLGATQSALAAALGALVGLLHNGTALPMVLTIATCGTAAFLVVQWLGVPPLHHNEPR
jgi:DHA1 family bicyclomycin/chloramphenicol resistance-like MFS transporter